jgi:hypothetical protein
MTYKCNVAFANKFLKHPAHQNFRYTNDLVYIEIVLGVPSQWGPTSYGLECFFVYVPLCRLLYSYSVYFNINTSALIPHQFFQSWAHWPVVAHRWLQPWVFWKPTFSRNSITRHASTRAEVRFKMAYLYTWKQCTFFSSFCKVHCSSWLLVACDFWKSMSLKKLRHRKATHDT